MSKKPVVLMVLDGYGLNDRTEGNAIAMANTPVMDKLMKECPFQKGYASGLAVGLPDGQMGNSEVGHMNIGAGRIIYQDLTRITKDIEDGTFFKNEELLEAMENCKKNDSDLHLFGLLSDGGILQSLLNLLGFKSTQLLYTEGAVLLGMVYNFIPFMILQINTSLSKMDKSLLEASSDLGANRFQTFWKVTFPLSIPGVISGIALVFLPAVSSFFIPKLLGGGQYFLIGNVIENQFITVGEWNFGSAISVIMAIVMMAIMYLVRYVEKRNSGNRKEKKA